MARYQLILAYDGTCFAGSQRQAKDRTVQSELEKALRRLGWSQKTVLLAGRTDRGVHASGQVAALDLVWLHGPDELKNALNAGLPADLVIRDVQEVNPDFHPRFDARSRQYCYRLYSAATRDPLRERYAWRVWPELDPEKLAGAAALLLGGHDFSAFGSPTSPQGSTTRVIMKSEWNKVETALPSPGGNEWFYEIEADAFLFRMVRKLVFIQVAAAQGRVTLEQIGKSLKKKTSLPAGLAPASGLNLVAVNYG